MKETCYLCGHSWGVTMSPRERVLCTPCARPTPSRRPAHYWHLRAWTGWDYSHYRSPEWWDQQTALQDLKHAAEVANQLWPTGN